MFGQTFQTGDLGTIGFLVVLEALLSADNALVLAIFVRHLSHEDQKKALFYGLGGAFVLRTAAILLAAYIINFWWLQLIGAIYLLYLPVKHFLDSRKQSETAPKKKMGFWATVVYLNIVDTAFALDSVIVAVAVVDTVRHTDKLWVVIAGATVGIIILRFAANAFIRILEKYPRLDHVAFLLVGWAGVKLLGIAAHSFEKVFNMIPGEIPELPPVIFWGGMALIAGGGSVLALRKPRNGPSEH
jgi:YkoY family integral membrane protein